MNAHDLADVHLILAAAVRRAGVRFRKKTDQLRRRVDIPQSNQAFRGMVGRGRPGIAKAAKKHGADLFQPPVSARPPGSAPTRLVPIKPRSARPRLGPGSAANFGPQIAPPPPTPGVL